MLHGTEKVACIEDIWKYSRTELLTGKVLIAWKPTKMLFTCARFTIWQIFCGNLPFPYQESAEISPEKYPHQLESRCVPGFYEATGGNILVCCLLSWAHEKWVSFTGVMLTQPEELATWRLEVTVREVLSTHPWFFWGKWLQKEQYVLHRAHSEGRRGKGSQHAY